MLCLICIQNCLILWSHYSPAVCRAIMDENIFFSLFKQLVDLPFAHISRGPGQQVSIDMCKCHMQTGSSVSGFIVTRNYQSQTLPLNSCRPQIVTVQSEGLSEKILPSNSSCSQCMAHTYIHTQTEYLLRTVTQLVLRRQSRQDIVELCTLC